MDKQQFMELCNATRGQGWASSDEEIWEVGSRIQELDPHNRILEIGVEAGKSLRIWEALAGPDGQVVGLDLTDNTGQQHFDKRPLIITGDSKDLTTLAHVKEVIPVLDFLFIDGDHSYEGVSSDFNMYSPLVRPGGLVGFHDLRMAEIARFFASISFQKHIWDAGSYGIGLVHIPE